jgi:hypothetical protein
LLNQQISLWPKIQSRIFEIGQDIAPRPNIKHFVGIARAAAMLSYLGPVQNAYGIISPKNRTAVTEIIMANHEGNI